MSPRVWPHAPAAPAPGGSRSSLSEDLGEVLVRLQSRLRLAAAHAGVRSRSQQDDVLQDAFLALLERAERPHCVEAWLVAVVKRLASRRRRSEQRRRDILQQRWPEGTSATPLSLQRIGLLRALGRLPPRQRSIVIDRLVVGLTAEEAARTRGISVHAADCLLSRSRANLRRHICEVDV